MDDSVLRIIHLEAENVKRLKAIRLNPDRTLVRIEGKNAAGKSAVLDSVAWALGGKKGKLDMPVRRGAGKARAFLDLGKLRVERRASAAGPEILEVTEADGTKLSSPQAVLNELIDTRMFDPVAFIRMSPTEQAEVLKRLAGLDWSKLDAERERLYAERTTVNREAKAAKAKVGPTLPKPADMTRTDISEVARKQQEASDYNARIDTTEQEIAHLRQELVRTQKAVDQLTAELDDLCKEDCLRIETGDIAAEIAEAQAHNSAIDVYETYTSRLSLATDAAEEADVLTSRIEAIDDKKAGMLLAATFPLPGLGLNEHGVTLNNVPFSQASSAEQLRTAVAIGLAEKRPCRVILIRDGSLLDEASLKELHEIALEYDAQVFLERVADSASPSAVYIEDGEIVNGAVPLLPPPPASMGAA